MVPIQNNNNNNNNLYSCPEITQYRLKYKREKKNYERKEHSHLETILGDPGATSRDDAIFSGERHFWRESLFQGRKSPWALFLTKRVPEVSKSVPLIGQKNISSPRVSEDA